MLMQGYEDANDVAHLQHDPLYKNIMEGDLASLPTISWFENSLDEHSIFALCHGWIDRYVSSLKGHSSITIDIDATDDPTHGNNNYLCSMDITGSLCTMNSFFTMGIPVRS
jgi:hypothetical protein